MSEEYDKEKYPHYKPSSMVEYINKPEDFEPEANFPSEHKFFGHRRCQAWSARQGRQCLRLAMDGSTKCYVHGGAHPGGAVVANFKHGKYSRYLPNDILQKYDEMKNDPDLLSLKNEVELVDIRIAQILENMSGFTDSTQWIRKLQDRYQKFVAAVKRQDRDEQLRLLRDIGGLVEKGASQRETWNELIGLFEAKKRLANAERERIGDMEAMLTAEEAMTFATALSTSFKNVLEKHIEDDKLRKAILTDQSLALRRILDRDAKTK